MKNSTKIEVEIIITDDPLHLAAMLEELRNEGFIPEQPISHADGKFFAILERYSPAYDPFEGPEIAFPIHPPPRRGCFRRLFRRRKKSKYGVYG